MDNITKYKNIKIVGIPTETFPQLVQIQKAPKKYHTLLNRKYITHSHAVMAIDEITAENLIRSGGKKVESELMEYGLKGIGEE